MASHKRTHMHVCVGLLRQLMLSRVFYVYYFYAPFGHSWNESIMRQTQTPVTYACCRILINVLLYHHHHHLARVTPAVGVGTYGGAVNRWCHCGSCHTARDLGVTLDAQLTLDKHVDSVVRSAPPAALDPAIIDW